MFVPAPLPPEVQDLIDQKKFDALEALWTGKMEENASDLPFFFGVAAAAKKKGAGAAAVKWLRFLADYHDPAAGDGRIQVLLEIARMSPTDADVRAELAAALRSRYAGHPVLAAVLAQFSVEKATDPHETAGRISRWLRFQPGEIYFMPGRGAGRLVEMNPALDVMRVEVGGARVPLSLVSAEKNLAPLPPEHFLRKKVEDPKALSGLAEKEPAETVRWLLASFGRPLTVQEIKDHLAGIVTEDRWSAFWTAARKHPQMLVSGSAKSAKVTWSESAGAAEQSVRSAFEKATPQARIDLARKHAKRSKDLARWMGQALAADAVRVAGREPALAWELSQAAARFVPGEPEAFPGRRVARVAGPAPGGRRDPRSPGPREGARSGTRQQAGLGGALHRADLPGGRRAASSRCCSRLSAIARRTCLEGFSALPGRRRARSSGCASGCMRKGKPSRPRSS